VTTPADVPQCLSCGACCFSQLEQYVPVSGDDHARLEEAAEQLVVFHGNRAFMRMHDGHCAALQVEVGPSGFQAVCAVYERRPNTCRELARGGAACAAERDLKAGRPLVAASALLARSRAAGSDSGH
jgi:uncharacterized protein